MDTATQANLAVTLAQRRLQMKKQMVKLAGRRTGEQWLALNQQNIKGTRYVPVIGKDGEMAMEEINGLLLQGRYQIDVEQLDESELRQERLGEAQARLQVAGQLAPVFAATNKPLNLQAFMDDYLDAAGIQDTASYYAAAPQQLDNQPSPQAPPGPGGVTSPDASNPFVQSGTLGSSQMMAAQGGAANVGQEMPVSGS